MQGTVDDDRLQFWQFLVTIALLSLGWVEDLGLAQLDLSATTERDQVVRYTVWLALDREGDRVAVRIYGYTHGFNEEHRCDREGHHEGPGRRFHEGTAAEGFNDAKRLIADGFVTMIEAWARQDT